MTSKTHYEVELKQTPNRDIVPVQGTVNVSVDFGALVFTANGPLHRVIRVFAPGEWTSVKLVETA